MNDVKYDFRSLDIFVPVEIKGREGLVNIMGGTVIETESDKIKIKLIIELGQEDGLDDEAIIRRLQQKIIGLPLNKAETYLAEYGRQLM